MVLQVPKQRRLHCKQNINSFHRALRGQERQEVFQSSCPQCKLLAFNNTLAFHELGACKHGQSTREGGEHVLGAGHYPAFLVLSVSVVVCCSEKVFGRKSLQTYFPSCFLYSSSVLLPILLVQYFQRPCVALHLVHLLRNCGTSSACSETRFRKRSKCPTHMSFTSWQLYSLSLYKDTRKFQSIDNIRHTFFIVIIKIVFNFKPNHK